jgi:hypothetical protein
MIGEGDARSWSCHFGRKKGGLYFLNDDGDDEGLETVQGDRC